MKKIITLSLLGFLIASCTTEIKNTDAKIEIEEESYQHP